MNQKQRDELSEIVTRLEAIMEEVREHQDQESEKFSNLSDGLKQSERGQRMEEASDHLGSAVSSIEEAIDYINSAIEG